MNRNKLEQAASQTEREMTAAALAVGEAISVCCKRNEGSGQNSLHKPERPREPPCFTLQSGRFTLETTRLTLQSGRFTLKTVWFTLQSG
jgi:hypothetical protein